MGGFAAYDSQIGETLWASLVHIRTGMTGSSDPRAGILQQSTDSVCLDPRGLRPLPEICPSVHVSGTFSQHSSVLSPCSWHRVRRWLHREQWKGSNLLPWLQHLYEHYSDPVPYIEGALGAVSNIALQVG